MDQAPNHHEQWAVIEKLPTIKRLRTSLFHADGADSGGRTVVDVAKLGAAERRLIIEKLINNVEEDNGKLLLKMKHRMDRVGVKQSRVEVKFRDLKVEAECVVVHGKPLPTLWNTFKSIFSVFAKVSCCNSQKVKLGIINGVTGIIKPSRMTLLLGPPGCGKTTLLKALAGELDHSLKVKGEIYYNGCKLENLMAQKASAYISQYDLHLPQMTVRETLDFSARCQGVESRTEIMLEVSRREKEAGIIPEPDIDTYMKATSISGLEKTVQTDYTLKILGLDMCADTIVGDAMRRGISGGQQRRLATGEMIVGPRRAFCMDEISNGLDSSTTFKIITCLQQMVHITDATALISLLQPAPETFELFDDIILYAEGKIVYQGPKSYIIKFFDNCGFKCPKRKGVADFLQEVISRKDQQQYWSNTEIPYQYVSVDEFSEKFKACQIGQQLHEELSKTNDYAQCEKNVLSHSKYSITNWQLFKACLDREILLMKRNSSLQIFQLVQLVITAVIAMTIFLGSRMEINLRNASYYSGSMLYGVIRILTNGVLETSVMVSKLPIFYKHRDINLYPAWAFSVPSLLLKIPLSLLESFIWTALTYYVMGYTPEVTRFFCQFFLFFALHQTSIAMFRFLASICQIEVPANFWCSVTVMIMLLFSGFIIPLSYLPTWLKWGFWVIPVSYATIGVSVNEFLAPRWMKVTSTNQTIGQEFLLSHGLNFEGYFYWVSVGALFGLAIVFNICFTLSLTFMKAPGISTTFISHQNMHQQRNGKNRTSQTQSGHDPHPRAFLSSKEDEGQMAKMVLHFVPLTLTFQNIQYSVDTPQEMRKHGFNEKEVQLLNDINGAFQPGKLTALMGESGAGKTTLLDVLAGRKTTGYIEGTIRVGGSPKIQETFARVSGYCEQSDIHSPQITVEESVIFSAWLRLPSEVDANTRAEFVKDVLEQIELDGIKDSLVGIPGKSGLSNEQRKRLTIGVELVSNPSVIFIDEPTSGLDARAAAIVMRAVKNIVETGRTVVCTIHQPSIDIFEAFDELILMKKGGQIIYSGLLGEHSSKLIEYFEGIPGVPRIKENYNPATWMLEITTTLVEAQLGLDFAQVYKESPLYRDNEKVVEQLAKPQTGSEELHFPTLYPQNSWEQFKACLWKQNLSYWRSPAHIFTRFMFTVFSSVLIAALMWQKGKRISNEQDLLNIVGATYAMLQFVGINTCSSIIPVIGTERIVLYREKFAGMYSSWIFSFAQVTVEVPYILVLTTLYVTITYPAMGLYWSAYKVFWYFYTTLCHFLFYSYFGMFLVSISPNGRVASMLGTACYTLLNLFAGYLMPGPAFPKWWVWLYWISPTSWSLRGIITSQYGDIESEITAFGEKRSIDSFLGDYFGFHHNQLALVAVVLASFPLLFASLFAFCVQKLNFQRR